MSNTRRAAVVAVVICALVFTLAVPLRTYVTQRAEISEQEAQRVELRQQVSALEGRQSQLADPVQVEAEARRRLRYVMPGETPYIVQLPEDKAQPQQQVPSQQTTTQGSWYERLWNSMHG
jgi:cell division protein FtsB